MAKFHYFSIIVLILPILSYGHLGHDHGDHEESSPESDPTWTSAHSVTKLNQQVGVDLKWISQDSEFLTMKMSCKTKGYLSVGFCTTWHGTMENCDIVLGWVDNNNGTAFLFDYYAKGNFLPVRDQSQDYQLIRGIQENGATTITFKRKWDTGDDNFDANLEHNHVHVIYAWHPEDPTSADDFLRHAVGSRGHTLKPMSFKDPVMEDHDHHNSGSIAIPSVSFFILISILSYRFL